MQNILTDLSSMKSVKAANKANWEEYHYYLGGSPSAELFYGPYLNWLLTSLPDHFMNLVVSTKLPSKGVDDLIESALTHFRSINISKLSWLVHEDVPAGELNRVLLDHGLTYRESFATEMAVDLSSLREDLPTVPGLWLEGTP